MKRILVTGAAGFIGSNLADHLLKAGHYVIGIDNIITGVNKNIIRLSKHDNFEFLKENIVDLDQKFIEKLKIEKFDEIFHLACPTGVPNLVTLAEEMLLTCSIGTKNILEIAKDSNAKFLLTSSSEVYGDPLIFPQRENYTGNVDSTGIRSPYEEGKRFAESLTVMYVRKYDLKGKIVRIFNTYGPNMSEKDLRVIPRFFEQIKNNQSLTVHGDGTQKRTYCHVHDLIDGLNLVMDKGEIGNVYNLGSREEISVMNLAKLMIDLSETEVGISTVQRPPHDHKARMPDTTKATRLGWSPKITLRDGLKRIFEEYLQLQQV